MSRAAQVHLTGHGFARQPHNEHEYPGCGLATGSVAGPWAVLQLYASTLSRDFLAGFCARSLRDF